MQRLLYNFKACKTNKVLRPAGVATCEGICINGRAFSMAKVWTIKLQSNGDVHHATNTRHKLHSILSQFWFRFVLFIHSGWFYISNFRSKRTVKSVQHIEWKPYCVHIITRVPHRTHILSVWSVYLTNYVSSKFCTALYEYVYKHKRLHHDMYTTLPVYHKAFYNQLHAQFSLFISSIVSCSSTCFERHSAHPQEDIVYMQYLVFSRSVCCHTWHSLRADWVRS
jgi:hypothetical protein